MSLYFSSGRGKRKTHKPSEHTRRNLSMSPCINVKRMKGTESSYLVIIDKEPYCIVETSPYMVWNSDHTFEFPISEWRKEKILELIHALENS